MGILEKLRPLPRWKHSDPQVRAAAVFELSGDDTDTILALARDDSDARVRRAAVGRLELVPELAHIAGSEPDDDVRAEAVRTLAGIAAEGQAGRALAAVAALVELGRLKELVAIVRDSTVPEVRTAVVEALADTRSLSAISRHGADGATRLAALAKISDSEELANIAVKAEHTDVAVAALERLTDVEALTSVSQRARNKVAARRARTRLRTAQSAQEPAPVVDIPRMSSDERARAAELIARAEGLVAMSDPTEAGAALSAVRLQWAEFHADVEVDPPFLQQFDAACEAVREAILEREREIALERERAEATAREQADRVAICEAIEQLAAGADADDQAAELKVRWDALPPMASEYAASLTRRFQDACRGFEDRGRRRRLALSAAGRLDGLADEVEQILASNLSLDETLARWRGIRRDAELLREFADANPPAAERLERAVAVLEEKEQEQHKVRARQEADNLKRLQQLCRQVEALVGSDALSLKAGDKALRDIKTALEDRAPLPTKQDRQDVQRRLEAARTALAPRLQELRDADEWQRWANLQVQEELCKEMEALKGEEKLDLAARRMRELQARWKEVALAPRAQGEALWRRFKTAQDEVFARTAAHFAAQHEERSANLARKQALCEKAEALAESTDWVRTATAIQQLQAEWKSIGPVSRGHEKAVWERFRAACDRFFTRRQEDLKHRKDEWAGNLAKKEALCARAEALATSTDWDATAAALRALQTEWKSIGPVRRAKSEAVWQRFRTACDTFFERYKHRDQVELQAKAAPRQQVLQQLEDLLPAADAAPDPPDGLYAAVQQARTQWQQAPELPRHVQQELAVRYHQALGRLVAHWPQAFAGTDLDPDATRQRMEKIVSRVEQLLGSAQPAAQPRLSPTEMLAQQLRERLAANTISGGARAENDESRWRAVDQEIRSAQSQWMRLGPVPPEVAGPLNERFQRACRRFYDQRRRAS